MVWTSYKSRTDYRVDKDFLLFSSFSRCECILPEQCFPTRVPENIVDSSTRSGISKSEISRKIPDILQNIAGMLSGSREYGVNLLTPSAASLFCFHFPRWVYLATGKIILGVPLWTRSWGNSVSDT